MVVFNDCGQEEMESCLIGIKFQLYKLTKLRVFLKHCVHNQYNAYLKIHVKGWGHQSLCKLEYLHLNSHYPHKKPIVCLQLQVWETRADGKWDLEISHKTKTVRFRFKECHCLKGLCIIMTSNRLFRYKHSSVHTGMQHTLNTYTTQKNKDS